MFSTLLLLLIFVIAIWIVQYHWQRRYLYKLAKEVHGPKPVPIFGNSLRLIMSSYEETLSEMIKMTQEYTLPCKFWLGPKLVYAVADPENLQIILNSPSCFAKDETAAFLTNVVGEGLLTATTPIWKKTRKVLAPFFKNQITNQFIASFCVHADEVVEEDLMKVAGTGYFNVFKYMERYSLAVIFEATLGVKLDVDTCHRIGSIITRAVKLANKRMMTIWQYPDFIFKRIESGKKYYELETEFLNIIEDIVQNRRKELEQNPQKDQRKNGLKNRTTYLDYLIEVSKVHEVISPIQLKHELVTLLAAGYDTTSHITSFILILLAMHPEIQKHVHEEVTDVLGADRFPDLTDLSRLVYLERVIKEALRLFPPGTLPFHRVEYDIKLPNFTMAGGSSVAIPILLLHRNEKYWPDPLKFDPDRFLPDEIKNRHPYAYMPFYAGPRNCLGQKFAIKSIKTIIAAIVRKFEVNTKYKSVEDIKLRIDFMISPMDGFYISLEKRQSSQ